MQGCRTAFFTRAARTRLPCHPEWSELASAAKDLTVSAAQAWEILRKLPRKCPLDRPKMDRSCIFIVRGAPKGHDFLRMTGCLTMTGWRRMTGWLRLTWWVG